MTFNVFADDVKININSGQIEPLPVAIADFTDKDGNSNQIGRQISEVISNNLVGSGQFKAIESAAFIAPPTSPSVRPNFTDWSPLGIKALVTGSVKNINNDEIEVEFRLWDVLAGKEMMALAFTTVPTNWRRVGHIISDKVYERLTGEKGYFDTRIIYVAEEGPKTNRIKKLAIMDQDGANNKFLT